MHPESFSNWEHPTYYMGIPDTNPDWCDHNGNGIRKARPGKFRVMAEDHKFYEDCSPVTEYDSIEEAVACASTHSNGEDGKMFWFFVYDDRGELVWNAEGKLPGWGKGT